MPRTFRVALLAAGLALTFPAAPALAEELPPQIRLDRYLVDIADQVRWENWERVCELYEAIEKERLPQPADFAFKYAEALFKAHRDQAAHDRLTSFVKRVDRDDPGYQAALQLLVEVDRRIAKVQEEAALEEARRMEEEAARTKAERERAEQRAKDMVRRGEFLKQQLALAETGGNGGLIAMGAGGAGVVLGTVALALRGGVGWGVSTLVVALGGAVLVGIGSLCAPDWSAPTTPIVLTSVVVGVPAILMVLVGLAAGGDSLLVMTMMAVALAGGGALAAGLGWELGRQRRIRDATRALEQFEAELKARPLTVPSADRSTPTPAAELWAFEF